MLITRSICRSDLNFSTGSLSQFKDHNHKTMVVCITFHHVYKWNYGGTITDPLCFTLLVWRK